MERVVQQHVALNNCVLDGRKFDWHTSWQPLPDMTWTAAWFEETDRSVVAIGLDIRCSQALRIWSRTIASTPCTWVGECQMGGMSVPEGSRHCDSATPNVRVESWCANRLGCSPRGTDRMCSFWISSMLPMLSPVSLARARLSGKLDELKGHMKLTCMYQTRPMRRGSTAKAGLTLLKAACSCEASQSALNHQPPSCSNLLPAETENSVSHLHLQACF